MLPYRFHTIKSFMSTDGVTVRSACKFHFKCSCEETFSVSAHSRNWVTEWNIINLIMANKPTVHIAPFVIWLYWFVACWRCSNESNISSFFLYYTNFNNTIKFWGKFAHRIRHGFIELEFSRNKWFAYSCLVQTQHRWMSSNLMYKRLQLKHISAMTTLQSYRNPCLCYNPDERINTDWCISFDVSNDTYMKVIVLWRGFHQLWYHIYRNIYPQIIKEILSAPMLLGFDRSKLVKLSSRWRCKKSIVSSLMKLWFTYKVILKNSI